MKRILTRVLLAVVMFSTTALAQITATVSPAVQLRWTAVVGATSYNVYRSVTGSPVQPVRINVDTGITVPVDIPAVTDFTVLPGVQYSYQIRPIITGTERATTATVVIKVPAAVTASTTVWMSTAPFPALTGWQVIK